MNEVPNTSVMLVTVATPAASFSPVVSNSPGNAEITTTPSQWPVSYRSDAAPSGADLSVSRHLGSADLFVERSAEMHWLDTHPDRAIQLAGEWIALDGDELVGHGRDLGLVLQQATQAGHAHPFITKVPDASSTFVF